MGTTGSRSNICPYCTVSIKLPDDGDNDNTEESQLTDNSILHCSRCHGAVKLKYSNQIIKQTQFESHAQAIQYIHIAPFADDTFFDELKISEEKEAMIDIDDNDIDDEMRKAIQMSLEQDLDRLLIDEYLKPFFNQHSNIFIKTGNRLIIKNIEFKVFACYPPYGYITNNTHFILNDPNNNGQLIQLQSRPIHRIHILPTKPSLDTFCKNTKKDTKDAMKEIFSSHIQIYLQGTDESLYIESSSNDSARSKQRYLMEEEKFVFKDIEFVVMKCQPFDGFIDLKLTKIFCNGDALNDIKTMSIRPISDGLPVNHKDYTSEQIENYYLKPFFYGKYKYIDCKEDDMMDIDGVSFMMKPSECIPTNGCISTATKIRNATPIRYWELLDIQQKKDEEYARRVQNEINGGYNRYNMNNYNLYGNGGNRLNRNNIDPFFQFIELLGQLNALRMEEKENDNDDQRTRRGINDRLINSLPTFQYKQRTTKGKEEESEQNNSCRVCLEEYKDGDELRALPCFHSFHTECVDQWLRINDKCPICKTSVIENS